MSEARHLGTVRHPRGPTLMSLRLTVIVTGTPSSTPVLLKRQVVHLHDGAGGRVVTQRQPHHSTHIGNHITAHTMAQFSQSAANGLHCERALVIPAPNKSAGISMPEVSGIPRDAGQGTHLHLVSWMPSKPAAISGQGGRASFDAHSLQPGCRCTSV